MRPTMVKAMKKSVFLLFLASASLIFANEQEDRGLELCKFTENVFNILQSKVVCKKDCKNKEECEHVYFYSVDTLKKYNKSSNPDIIILTNKFVDSFTNQSDDKEYLADAISDLGRLLKCSVDDKRYRTETPYLIHRKDLNKQIVYIESKLGDRLPKKGVNHHKLMMESLADEDYDIALYAYLKIAINRCEQTQKET